MIAAWMLFSLVTGCALTAAATAIDHIAFLARRPRRFTWLTALVLTCCWPAIALFRGAPFALRHSPIAESPQVVVAHRPSAFAISTPSWDISPHWSVVILVAWGLLSSGLIARVVLAARQIKRHRNAWRAIEIDGMNVHLTTDVGPAVIGLRPMHVVLPEWVLGMDPPLRGLILRHEAEHRAARDPYLLLVGTLMTALIPWNLPLWFQMRRLRLAIELDCDARVLNLHPRWEQYALLLLTIAQRRSGARQVLAPALSESTSNLERRITAMRTMPILSRFRAVCLSLAATAAFALACAVDKPESPDSPKRAHVPANQTTGVAGVQSADRATTTFFEFQVDKPVVARETSHLRYPASMRGSGISGELWAQYVVDETGRVDMQTFKTLKSPGPAFTAAVKTALPTWRFDPAVVHGQEVKQLVQQAFIFRLPPDA